MLEDGAGSCCPQQSAVGWGSWGCDSQCQGTQLRGGDGWPTAAAAASALSLPAPASEWPPFWPAVCSSDAFAEKNKQAYRGGQNQGGQGNTCQCASRSQQVELIMMMLAVPLSL